MRIAVTGINGFIAYHLINTLKRKSGVEVVLIDRPTLYNRRNLILKLDKCDFIVHLAGVNRSETEKDIYDTNIKITNSIIEALNYCKTPPSILFASSTKEETGDSYGQSKLDSRLMFESWVRDCEKNVKVLSLIIPNIFGPFCKPFYNSFISTFCHQVVNAKNPNIIIDDEVGLIFISDLVEIIINIILKNKFDNTKKYFKNVFNIKVSKVLSLIQDFHKIYSKNIIPRFNNAHEKKIFLTYHSYILLNESYPKKIKKHIDERGFYSELYKSNSLSQTSYSSTNPGIIRGNHYHTRKIERFIVLKGNALIKLRKVGSSYINTFSVSGEYPVSIDIPVWHTHSIENIGKSELVTIFCIDEIFDLNNADTHYELVE